AAAAPAAASRGKTQMTELDALLALYVTDAGAQWRAYDGLAAAHWNDPAPVENDAVADPALRFSRRGHMLLAGFGEAALPDGHAGADAGARMGNEGEAGLTLNGDADRVNEVAIVKFYPSDDYAQVLAAQLPSAAVAPVADQCTLDAYGSENVQKNAFYRIDLGGERAVFVEAFVDEDGGPAGPGSTTFVFTRDKPAARIASMRCRER
ncbi:MAG: hypothetical protein ACTHOH_12090, partial [Lysobacteraceae bacterium]